MDAARRTRLLCAAALVAGACVGTVQQFVQPVVAAGSPDIVLTKTADSDVLIGNNAEVTLQACNPSGPDGFNLSFRDVVPAGMAPVVGSPAASQVLLDKPAAGQTTLIWSDVSDLLTGACVTITYAVDTDFDSSVLSDPVGTTFGTIGGAYVSANAFDIPDFDANGQPTTDITGSDTDGPTATTLSAIEIVKTPGNNGEGELTRGVHGADPKLYTLTVTNNASAATNNFTVVDVLPPNLEFLGCVNYYADDGATTDPITNPVNPSSEEYVGSGPMATTPATAACIAPASVETLDGATMIADGPTPPVGATRVTWTGLGNLGPAGSFVITYLAGIPLRANTDTWAAAGKPSNASLAQGRNLDNNNGAPTFEDGTEPSVTNRAAATGHTRARQT